MGDLYGRIMPSSKKQLNDKAESIKKETLRVADRLKKIEPRVESICIETEALKKQGNDILEFQQKESEVVFDKFVAVSDKFTDLTKTLSCIVSEIKKLEERISSIDKKLEKLGNLDTKIGKLSNDLKTLDKQERAILRASNEDVWASVFHDAVAESPWLKKRTFYPGRWAAGYQLLYVLYRTLNDFHPTSILELGLGQTTRVIAQYAAYASECHHIVVEHDREWIDIFNKEFELSDNSEIVRLDIDKKVFNDTAPTTVYVGFGEKFKGQKFDLISIDAPFGGNELTYSRMDTLQLLPDCLKEDFVILLDDYNREAERNMIELVKKVLTEHDIKFNTGVYRGNKDTFMITSESLRFLCTM